MKNFLLTWLGTAVALLITANIVPGFVVNSFVAALVAVAVIGLVNAFVRPILSILTFPITLLTFGLFTFVLNGLMLWLASLLTPKSYFEIENPLAAFLGSIVLSVVSSVINYILRTME
ncbi:phage holin family protein [Nostoc sp. UHCC 0870]|uniref:phage holin family protein n=1 Tax=Nostoc sp. UHCC 0870 TaxID=2914041 RepID=UPI001EE08BC5|nr:phage holin family protein [Nostoc sp. UHCC 0870]UKO96692.1 phage holin family protein [Nostoc sp. UHCC 0870]